MSWLNSSLNTIKGQLSTLAQEVLAETAGPGDAEYRGSVENLNSTTDLLLDTRNENETLKKLCNEQKCEIEKLRKQNIELQTKMNEGAFGSSGSAMTTATGRNSKSPTDNNTTLEDSWCWAPDNTKNDTDYLSETSSGNGNELVQISLEDVPFGNSAGAGGGGGGGSGSDTNKTTTKTQNTTELQKRIKQLEHEKNQLMISLEDLDSQHNAAMQNVLELKEGLQEKLLSVTKNYETLKKEHDNKFINSTLELAKVNAKLQNFEKENEKSEIEKRNFEQKINSFEIEIKKMTQEMAILQELLDKRNNDNIELIECIKTTKSQVEKLENERAELTEQTEKLKKELEENKNLKEKKTSESSTSSVGKQSEEEFIVVREGDAASSAPTTPPTKEELKDKIVQLENRISELTLESGSVALQLQDRDTERELSVNVINEKLLILQKQYESQTNDLENAKKKLAEEINNNKINEKNADNLVIQQKLNELEKEKQQLDEENSKMKNTIKTMEELEKRLLLSEQEKENLQIELQSLRLGKERILELESKLQKLILENQELQLNIEAEEETSNNNSAEIKSKIKFLAEENQTLRAELDSISQIKDQEKKEITDLDADDEEPFSQTQLRELLHAYVDQDYDINNDSSVEKTYKALREKFNKIDTLEKNLAMLSEEIVDLQDSKLVWDHEKKTLEADISQYIIQCDELMKNNEILLNELENYKRNKLETIHENNEENIVQLEAQLEECSKINRTLEEEYSELNEKIDILDREKQELTENLRLTQQMNESLKQKQEDLKQQIETLKLDKSNVQFELNELKSNDDNNQNENENLKLTEEKCQNLESQLKRLSKDHADLVGAMQAQKISLESANKKREIIEKISEDEKLKIIELQSEIETNQKVLKDYEEIQVKCKKIEEDLKQKESYIQSLEIKLADIENLKLECSIENENTKAQLQEQIQLNSKLEKSFEAEINQLNESQKNSINLNLYEELKLEKQMLQNEMEQLKERFNAQTTEIEILKDALKTAPDKANDNELLKRIAQLESELLATADIQKSVETLNFEKTEMIKALQQKHSENMQYYLEIQRLQPIVQQLQQQLTITEAKICENCPKLEKLVTDFKKEQEKLLDQINFLKEKSDILTTNLLTEQTHQKLIRQEKSDVEDANLQLKKDLERLREHLLEVEDLHTLETIELQKDLEDTKAKMIALQEEVSKSSTAYTSASIRANQHAETLQAQYALLVQQRDELLIKLSSAEDRELKSQAALCNLQCALEQLQNNTENDVKSATQRIRKELQQEFEKQTQLEAEIIMLNQQLTDANQGLRAAARLSDQLETCQRSIANYKEELNAIKQQNVILEEKLSSSENSQNDKVEKNLIKSLLIGYIVNSNPNDKNQVLRVISSVLDFTQSESVKCGLNKQQSSWLGSILGSGSNNSTQTAGAQNRDNLMQAFLQFLEQESQPKVDVDKMPNLLNITQNPTTLITTTATTASTTTTTLTKNNATPTMLTTNSPLMQNLSSSNNDNPLKTTTTTTITTTTKTPTTTTTAVTSISTTLPIQPLLLNSNILNEFAPTRNSTSILKDILNDS